MFLSIKDGLNTLYNFHKTLYNLNNSNSISISTNYNIYTTYNLYSNDLLNIANMFHIENNYQSNNTYIPYGILSNIPSIYRNHTILSFLHPNNKIHSTLYSSQSKSIKSISNWTYTENIIDTNNTLNCTIIVTPPQSLLLWKKTIKDYDKGISLITSVYDFNKNKNKYNNILIISSNLWNTLANDIFGTNKYVLRLIIDDFHLINIINAQPIKFKFIWFVSNNIYSLLHKTWNKPLWKNDFADICVNLYKNINEFNNLLNSINSNDANLTDDYINSIASNEDIIKYNLYHVLKYNRQWDTSITYKTPHNIFYRQSHSFTYFNFRKGFFKDLLYSILMTACNLPLYNNITSYQSSIISDKTLYVNSVYCSIEHNIININKFIKEDKYDKNKLVYYFDCHNNKEQLILSKNNDLSNNLISKPEFDRINNILSNNESCSICYNDLDDKLIITSCCKNIMHYECIFNCFTNTMICPICRLTVMINKSSIIDSSLLNIHKMVGRFETISSMIDKNYKNILIIDNIITCNIMAYNILYKNVIFIADRVNIFNHIDRLSINDEKIVYILMKNDIEKFDSLDLSYIDLLIVCDDNLSSISLLEGQLFNQLRKNDLHVLHIKSLL